MFSLSRGRNMWFERTELLEFRKAINAHPMAEIFEGGKPITGTGNRDILDDMEWAFDALAERHPGQWKEGFPPKAVEWWEKLKARDGHGKGFFHLHRDCIPGLVALGPSRLKVFLVCAGFANNGRGTNEAGMAPGEFFHGNGAIARAAGVNPTRITEHLAALEDLGLVAKVRKHKCGTWVRRVSMAPGPEWERATAEGQGREDGRKTNRFPERTIKRL
jgi:DNA-binding transcriptional ArsR family regulator